MGHFLRILYPPQAALLSCYKVALGYVWPLPLRKELGHSNFVAIPVKATVRDWSLIMGRGGATKWENRGSETFCAPPQDRVKLFVPPLLKGGNFLRPPITMAKTSSSCVKTTSKFSVPPPPSFSMAKISHAPPSRFVAPPLPVISDQSLMMKT